MSATFKLGPGEMRAKKAWILLIDDSRFIRRLLKARLEGLGYRVETASDGRAGIQLASEHPYDLVVVDGLLPDIEGRDVCRQITKLPGEKPLLVLYTASDRLHQERQGAFRDGVDVCLKKDVDGTRLLTRIEELLATGESRRAGSLSA